MDRVTRLGGYAFWTTAGFMLPLIVDRLIVLPELNKHLGAELFGGFVWVIGVLNMFTNAGSAGCAVMLMRDMAAMERDQAVKASRTAWTLSLMMSIVILTLAATVSMLFFAPPNVRANMWVMGGPLLAYCVLSGTIQIIITVLRIRRRFAFIFALKAIEAGVLLINLAVAPSKLLWLIGVVYIASMVGPMVYGLLATPEFRGRSWLDRQAAKWLLAGWAGGALISLSESTQRNLARVLLGSITKDETQIATLYAGTSIGNIFVMPVSRLSMLILALLAGHSAFALKGRRGTQYAIGVALLMVLVGGSSYLFGGWLVYNRYPELASETMKFYHWIALANALGSIVLMMRPVAIKYAPLWLATAASVAGAIIQVIALSIFIPLYQAEGAAIGLVVAAGCSSLMWVVTYVLVGRKHKDTESAPDNDHAPGV